jgi:hypothetical protein
MSSNSTTQRIHSALRTVYATLNEGDPRIAVVEAALDALTDKMNEDAALSARVAELEGALAEAADALEQAGARIAQDHKAALERNGQIYPVPCAAADHATVAAYDARALLGGGK